MTLKDDIKDQFKENYLKYASYVILDRAIPHLTDGLKPVQRRILWTLFGMDDGKLHKVANVAGQTMALHPHGDAPIVDALVTLANKGFLLDRQGNFGNPHTGDPAAAARYIETRLTQLAKDTLFNPELTPFMPSYDGRAQEPIVLPVKIPLLLMQGAEGIAVGMATRIFPHNFAEILQAQIDILEGKTISLLPDFQSGGIMDASEYDQGRGKIRLRAKIDIIDDKTLVIREICPGTTTESVIASIDEAAKKGKIKIDAINDYTAEKIEIEIKLPRGQYATAILDALYGFTDCEVSLSSQVIAIKDDLPWEGTIPEILEHHAQKLTSYLKQELEIEQAQALEKLFYKTLEQIFIENRLYKKIEQLDTAEKIHVAVEEGLKPFHSKLMRIPTHDDRERLLAIPIRRISLFDIKKHEDEKIALEERLQSIEKDLKNLKKVTITFIHKILKKYGPLFPRKTQIKTLQEVDIKELSKQMLKIGYDAKTGFLGTKVTEGVTIECTNLDKLLILTKEGTYKVIAIPEKVYIPNVIWLGPADKKTSLQVLYRDKTTQYPYAKRFIVKQFILDKTYSFLEDNHKLEYLSSSPNAKVQLSLKGKGKQKEQLVDFDFSNWAIKNPTAKGARIANRELSKVKEYKKD
jgi:topoisomerase-4 subunit A